MSFAGRVVVCLTYMIEYLPYQYQDLGPWIILVFYPINTIAITFWYQFINNDWMILQLICVSVQILATTYIVYVIPESPKWLYTWKNFSKSREVLAYVAKFNGVDKDTIQDQITNADFIDDVTEEEQSKIDLDTSIVYQKMPQGTYIKNMIVQAILWSCVSFTYYVLSFMTKYYEGGIYLNYYLDGSSGLIGVLFGLPFYRWLKMRMSFIIALSSIFIGLIFVLLF